SNYYSSYAVGYYPALLRVRIRLWQLLKNVFVTLSKTNMLRHNRHKRNPPIDGYEMWFGHLKRKPRRPLGRRGGCQAVIEGREVIEISATVFHTRSGLSFSAKSA